MRVREAKVPPSRQMRPASTAKSTGRFRHDPANCIPLSTHPVVMRTVSHHEPPRAVPVSATLVLGLALLVAGLVSSCDQGLAPPKAPPTGRLQGTIAYVESTWPPRVAVRDLRFVALPFVPRDTSDLFRDLDQLVISEPLRYGVAQDTFVIPNVPAGTYVYSGVAQQFSADVLDWRPVGLVEQDGGIVQVRAGMTTTVRVMVDFTQPPPFPPSQP